MNNSIYEIASHCLEISDQRITVNSHKVTIPRKLPNMIQISSFIDFDVEGDTQLFVHSVSQLIAPLLVKYPTIALDLQRHLSNYQGREVIMHHCAIVAILKCLVAIEKPFAERKRKIFISHSTKDRQIVKSFAKLILELGIGITADDVFCTSIESMTMRNGEDIRQHIKNNILTADFSLLMISNNYKLSEICLNEMGAVWTANNHIRYYLLPDTTFDTIGWLNNPNRAEKLNDPIALDSLQKEIIGFYGLTDKGIVWSENRTDFLSTLK